MPKLNPIRARRVALASLCALPLASSAAMAVTASPAVAHAQIAKKKKKKKKQQSKGFTVKVKSGTLTIAFTSTAWASLSGGSNVVGTATTPTGAATSTPNGSFSFPITGGTLNSLTGQGTVASSGGFTISRHLSVGGLFESSSSESAESPTASLGKSSSMIFNSANFTPPKVALFQLSTAHVKVIGSKSAVTL